MDNANVYINVLPKPDNVSSSTGIIVNSREVSSYDPSDDNKEITRAKTFLDKMAKIIPYIFLTIALLLVGMFVMGFIPHDSLDLRTYAIYGIFVSVAFCGPFGAWCVFKFGVIQDQIDRLREENAKFEHEIGELTDTRVSLGDKVGKLKTVVNHLKVDGENLEANTEQFSDLIEELKEIAQAEEELLAVLDETNLIFDNMREIILENERTHFIACFYECAFRDDDNEMDEDEYERFLGRLSPAQRKNFINLGPFKRFAGKNGCVDLRGFQDMLEIVLVEVDQVLSKEFSNQ